MDLCVIAWQPIATFSSGLLAVGAALWIGLKQVGISRQQVRILQMQAETARWVYKKDLFDKRYAVFDLTGRYLVEVLQNDDAARSMTAMEFDRVRYESVFLFNRPISAELNSISEKSRLYMNIRKEVYDSDEPVKKRELIQGLIPIQEELQDILQRLVDIFEGDLKLSGPEDGK